MDILLGIFIFGVIVASVMIYLSRDEPVQIIRDPHQPRKRWFE